MEEKIKTPEQVAIHNCKLIMAKNFEEQRKKPRNTEDQVRIGDALTAIEIDTQKDINRLLSGDHIRDIIPGYKKDYEDREPKLK